MRALLHSYIAGEDIRVLEVKDGRSLLQGLARPYAK
jgi:hypothetical protein